MFEEVGAHKVKGVVGQMAENTPGLKGTMEVSGETCSASSTVGGRNERSTPFRRICAPFAPV